MQAVEGQGIFLYLQYQGKAFTGSNEHVLHFGNMPAGIYQVILHMGVLREVNMLLVE